MRILSIMTVCAVIALLPMRANGDTYASDQYGFTAEFPAEATVGEPQGAETDARGNYISRSVIVQSRVLGVWTAMVTVETYTVARRIDVGTTLTMMPKMFAAQLDATITANRVGKVGPYRARFFSFQTRDHKTTGKGIAIVVPAAKPRTYLVLTTHSDLASEQNVAALDGFLNSFQLH